ncbi:MAG TPA: hypothetical protein DHV15_00985 [Treponema sp.]|uniref:Uncharacterized protein n=1 Tax=Treponema denticola (strain ATCC 35405 / DSM 14222 / CIP 103919 / JCM 8153 / KCTC 15104) TaxID=243275 RepID=Q73PC8_TREDE|nr:hypothetical protein TDE_0871 [Treponema denticola ATCC 35405]HCY94077.1 hypothetical protein [Treponema sp.]
MTKCGQYEEPLKDYLLYRIFRQKARSLYCFTTEKKLRPPPKRQPEL